MKKSFLFLICFAVLFSVESRGGNNRIDKCDTNLVVRGYVLEKATGNPIENARISMGNCGNDSEYFSDAEGLFEVHLCSHGYYEFYITADGYASSKRNLHIKENQPAKELKIELPVSSAVAGFVKNETGDPIADAEIRPYPYAQQVKTDVNGFYEIDDIDSEEDWCTLKVRSENYPPESIKFKPAGAGMMAECDVLLKSGVTIHGKVTDLYGTAVSGADVGPITSHYMLKQATTDYDGYYKLKNIKKGELVLSVYHSKYPPFIETFQIEEQETERQINIKLENPKSFHARVVDKQGNGLEGVKVRILEVNDISYIYPSQEQCTSNSKGEFVIGNAPVSGRMKLRLDSSEISGKFVEIDLSKPENIIEVDMGGEVYGRVIDDATGQPVPEFNVKLGHSYKSQNSGTVELFTNRE